MPRIEHNKLVRDKIPEIIAANGGVSEVRTLNDDEYRQALLIKLVEEAQELLESGGSVEERADVAEVLRALDQSFGFDADTVDRVQQEKLLKRGGFTLKLFLESATTND